MPQPKVGLTSNPELHVGFGVKKDFKSVGIRKEVELWGRILSGERVIYERKGWSYSVGMNPPHVRIR